MRDPISSLSNMWGCSKFHHRYKIAKFVGKSSQRSMVTNRKLNIIRIIYNSPIHQGKNNLFEKSNTKAC